MGRLDICINNFSLVFTNTITARELRDVNFYFEKKKVNYDNSISLYDLIEKFNKLYLSFKREYEELDKFDLGEYIEISKFVKYERENYRHLLIHVNKPIISDKETTKLYLMEHKNDIAAYVTNDINENNVDYYRYEIDLDKDKIRKYLDLFDKYAILLYLYHHFQHEMIFGDGTYTLFTKVKSNNNNFLKGLEKFELCLGTNHFNAGDYISLSINLGDNFGIDICNSKMELDYHSIKALEDDYLKVLKNVYINEKYLNTYWDRVDHEEKVSAKSLIKSADNV